MTQITQELAQEYFSYEDGVLFCKKKTGPRSAVGMPFLTRTSQGYIALQFMGKAYKAHQIVYLLHHGSIPKEIDHINGIRMDNRIENLRSVNRRLNCANQKTQGRSKSGFKGVTKLHKNNKWRARIKHNQKEIYIGLFDSAESAANAYNQKASELFGDFAKLNAIGDKL